MDIDGDDDMNYGDTPMAGSDDEGEFNPADFKDQEVGDAQDVLKDGTVTKTVIRVGEGYAKPEKHYEVFINYTAWYGEGDNKKEFDSATARAYTIGGEGMCEGLDAALKQMKKGEKAKVNIAASMAFGEQGSAERGVPPNEAVEYEVELDDWHTVEEVSKTNGGVLVKTIADSSHWEKPREEDVVFLRYRLRLLEDDTWLFSQGYGEGKEPKRYLLSELPLAGLREGLKMVKRGSKVDITMTSDFAYGSKGDEQLAVPPNATLVAQVEFSEMHVIEDPNKDGGVRVELKPRPDAGWQKGKIGAKCTISYKAVLQGEGPEEPRTFKEESDLEIELGGENGEDVTVGLEQALEFMVVGQQAEVTVKPEYGYGKAGKDNWVGADDTIVYHVTLQKLEPGPSVYNLSTLKKKEYCDSLRTRGNEAFKRGDTRRALRQYLAAVEPFKHADGIAGTEDKAVAQEVRGACYLNLAACYDKIADWPNSLSACNKALEAKADNKKALFRRAKALLGLGRLIDAKMDLEKLQNQDAGDKAVLGVLAELRKKERVADMQDKAIFSKMFS